MKAIGWWNKGSIEILKKENEQIDQSITSMFRCVCWQDESASLKKAIDVSPTWRSPTDLDNLSTISCQPKFPKIFNANEWLGFLFG
jgi:hypothetical protein